MQTLLHQTCYAIIFPKLILKFKSHQQFKSFKFNAMWQPEQQKYLQSYFEHVVDMESHVIPPSFAQIGV